MLGRRVLTSLHVLCILSLLTLRCTTVAVPLTGSNINDVNAAAAAAPGAMTTAAAGLEHTLIDINDGVSLIQSSDKATPDLLFVEIYAQNANLSLTQLVFYRQSLIFCNNTSSKRLTNKYNDKFDALRARTTLNDTNVTYLRDARDERLTARQQALLNATTTAERCATLHRAIEAQGRNLTERQLAAGGLLADWLSAANDVITSVNDAIDQVLYSVGESPLIYPSTKWCGHGNIAASPDDLGRHSQVHVRHSLNVIS